MALPPAKSRHRSEPPPLSLDADQNHCGHLLLGGVGGWDLKEEYEGGGKQGREVMGVVRGASRDILII